MMQILLLLRDHVLRGCNLLFKDLIKNTPYDMAEIRARAEGVFRVLESREKLSKKVTAISVEKATLEHN